MAGYSKTPLAQKLGIKPGFRVRTVNAPANYLQLIAPVPDGVTVSPRLRTGVDMVHLFVDRHAQLEPQLSSALALIADDGMIWVSWPKKASGVDTDVTEDVIRREALKTTLVDVKVCAVDETWSGLKLVIRKKHRR
ncbi:MAG: DUF3052 family protein [Woeseiaceae bacterium]|nr:DUF3052 family protein [Woeseiaceae bacterium]